MEENSMTYETKFGSITIDKKNHVHIVNGLYGFEDFENYAITPVPNVDSGKFVLMLNLDQPELSFILTPIVQGDISLLFEHDMNAAIEELEFNHSSTVFYAVTTIRKKANQTELSLNLMAPMVIDFSIHKGQQHIFRGKDYPVRHSIKI